VRLLALIPRILISAVIAILPTVVLIRLYWNPRGVPHTVEGWPLQFEGIVADPVLDRVFVGVPGYGRIYVYTAAGQFLHSFKAPGGSLWLEPGPDHTLYVTGSKTSLTRSAYDANGTLLAQTPRADGPDWDSPSRWRWTSASKETWELDRRYGQARVLRTDSSGRTRVIVDRSAEAGIAHAPARVAVILGTYAAMVVLIFFMTGPKRPKRRKPASTLTPTPAGGI
jgi:hypothetical protein